MPDSFASAVRSSGPDSVRIACHVRPGARKTEVQGLYGEAVKLSLASPPVDGKANHALCVFMAELCGVPKSSVTLISGQTSRDKVLSVSGASQTAVCAALAAAAVK